MYVFEIFVHAHATFHSYAYTAHIVNNFNSIGARARSFVPSVANNIAYANRFVKNLNIFHRTTKALFLCSFVGV